MHRKITGAPLPEPREGRYDANFVPRGSKSGIQVGLTFQTPEQAWAYNNAAHVLARLLGFYYAIRPLMKPTDFGWEISPKRGQGDSLPRMAQAHGFPVTPKTWFACVRLENGSKRQVLLVADPSAANVEQAQRSLEGIALLLEQLPERHRFEFVAVSDGTGKEYSCDVLPRGTRCERLEAIAMR